MSSYSIRLALFCLVFGLTACTSLTPETPSATVTLEPTFIPSIIPSVTPTITPFPNTATSTIEPSPTETALPTATLDPFIKVIQTDAVLNSVAFSPDGKRLVVGTNRSTAEVWEVASGEKILTLIGHTQGDVSYVAYSPDGTLIATAGQDRTVRLWDANTGDSLRVLAGGEVTVAFSPDGQWVAAGGKDGVARVWHVASGELRFAFSGHPEGALSVAFDPGASITFTLSAGPQLQPALASKGVELQFRPATYHPRPLSGMGENALAVGTGSGEIVFWNLETGEKIRTVKASQGRVWSLAYIYSRYLFSGGDDGLVRLWLADDPTPYKTLAGHKGRIWNLSVAPHSGRGFAASGGADHTVRLWSDTPLGYYTGHTDQVYGVAFDPTGDMLASVGRDKTIRLWHPVRTWHFPTSGVSVKPECVRGEIYTTCEDVVLDISFEYPNQWGEINAEFRPGEDGYSYEYSHNTQDLYLQAGGRSRDFSEGRDGFITDFWGGAACSAEEPMCETIQPDVVFKLAFPKARETCFPGPGTLFYPIATVAINLPSRPSIHGFIFISHFLSANLTEELMQTLGPKDPQSLNYRCDEADRKLFDAKTQEIIQRIRSGFLDQATKTNLEQLRHLAQSVVIK